MNLSIATEKMVLLKRQKEVLEQKESVEKNEYGKAIFSFLIGEVNSQMKEVFEVMERLNKKSIKKNHTFKLNEVDTENLDYLGELMDISKSKVVSYAIKTLRKKISESPFKPLKRHPFESENG